MCSEKELRPRSSVPPTIDLPLQGLSLENRVTQRGQDQGRTPPLVIFTDRPLYWGLFGSVGKSIFCAVHLWFLSLQIYGVCFHLKFLMQFHLTVLLLKVRATDWTKWLGSHPSVSCRGLWVSFTRDGKLTPVFVLSGNRTQMESSYANPHVEHSRSWKHLSRMSRSTLTEWHVYSCKSSSRRVYIRG